MSCYIVVEADDILDLKVHESKFNKNYIKILWNISSNFINSNGIKKVIKDAIKYGIDGFVISDIQQDQQFIVQRLAYCLKQLPHPYDFDWIIYSNVVTGKSHNSVTIDISVLTELY